MSAITHPMDQGPELDDAPPAERQDEPTLREQVRDVLLVAHFTVVQRWPPERLGFLDTVKVLDMRDGPHAWVEVQWSGPSKLAWKVAGAMAAVRAALAPLGVRVERGAGLSLEVGYEGDVLGSVERVRARRALGRVAA